MIASGIFEIVLEPQKDDNVPAGRMVIQKQYKGDIDGSGSGQIISKRTENGIAVYFAIEEFEGFIDGKKGAFTLVHNGYMSEDIQSLDIKILEGSATGELENISGKLEIFQDKGSHQYKLEYEL